MTRGVIFDVDGTLLDSNDAHAHAWVEALGEHGHRVDFDRVRPLIGMGGDKLLPTVAGIEEDSPEGRAVSRRRGEIFRTRYLPDLQAFPRVVELVHRLRHDGLHVAVASSASAEDLAALLDKAHVREWIEDTTSKDDAASSKPDPDIVHAALDRLRVPPDEAVMVGDTPYDVEAAAKAGVRAIALRSGGHWSDEDFTGAAAVYDDPADLLRNLTSSPVKS
jgi:HAD superfamily hydrolase (TIGR01509 family)